MTTTQIAASLGRLHLLVAFDPKEVGRRIAAARDRKGWTQLQFALAAKVSPSSVSRWERGKLPPVRELMRIAVVGQFGCKDSGGGLAIGPTDPLLLGYA